MADPDAGFPEFRPRLPWWSGDLQTCRNQVAGRPVDLSEFRSRRLRLPTSDGSGDCQQAVLSFPAAGARRLPLLLLHGLTGSEDSYYLRASARHFLRHGHPVLRVNLRGAGPSGTACRVRYLRGQQPGPRGRHQPPAGGTGGGRRAGDGLFAGRQHPAEVPG